MPAKRVAVVIYLVTGPIGGGKSTMLRKIQAGLARGDGVVNRRLFEGTAWAGQELIHLTTRAYVRFSSRNGYAPPQWDVLWRLGDLTISREGMAFAEGVLENIMAEKIEPIFLDEIGPLELGGRGFHRLFQQMLDSKRTVFAAVRDGCLKEVVNKYGLEEFTLIRAAPG